MTDYAFDTAGVSEHEHTLSGVEGDHLARNEPALVFADSGCRGKRRVEEMRARGVTPALCHRRVRGQPFDVAQGEGLTPEQKRSNRLIAPVRAFVEHPFAWFKRRTNNRRVRYRGAARNGLDVALMCVAYNFCRVIGLRPGVAAA